MTSKLNRSYLNYSNTLESQLTVSAGSVGIQRVPKAERFAMENSEQISSGEEKGSAGK